MKHIILTIIFTVIGIAGHTQTFYKGTTMGFANRLADDCGIVFKENNVSKDPFQSLADHGANIVRFAVDLPPYTNQVVNPEVLDYRSIAKTKVGLQDAKNAGLGTLLTFGYNSMALDPDQRLNDYVAPLAWQDAAANDFSALKDLVYNHTYDILEEYVLAGLTPEVVTIGNETNWRILEPNVDESSLDAFSFQRVVDLLNQGSQAVRDINTDYGLDISIGVHIFDASNLQWWMNNTVPLGLDFDIMCLSHYHGWHTLGTFQNWAAVVNWVKTNYNKDFMILETAQLFISENDWNDSRTNILGADNIPAGYPNPATTQTQKDYLTDLATEISDAGGVGVIAWGGDLVASTCHIYPDEYGVGSSWENKTFWDFNNNLHDGVNWMQNNYLGTNESELEALIKIYPNPSIDRLTIDVGNGNTINKDIRIFDVMGREIRKYKLSGTRLELKTSTLQSGIYFLEIIVNDTVVIKKFMKK